MHPSELDISSHRRPSKDIIDKTCPNSSDIEIARKFLFLIEKDAQRYFRLSEYFQGLENVVYWMQVKSCILLCGRNWYLKLRQANPDFPPELIRQYQLVINVLKHYSLPKYNRPVIHDDRYFFQNVHKAPRSSIVDSWTSVKKLLRRWT